MNFLDIIARLSESLNFSRKKSSAITSRNFLTKLNELLSSSPCGLVHLRLHLSSIYVRPLLRRPSACVSFSVADFIFPSPLRRPSASPSSPSPFHDFHFPLPPASSSQPSIVLSLPIYFPKPFSFYLIRNPSATAVFPAIVHLRLHRASPSPSPSCICVSVSVSISVIHLHLLLPL
ncbi:hypothetical protein ACLOJK_018067, partial [Asimina triloba]